jgi:maleate isomerase
LLEKQGVMKEYYGWRAKIGLIYMASSTVMEPEFHAMAPEGVSIHTDRIVLPKVTISGLEEMMGGDEILGCTSLLASAPLDVIVFGGTSATFLHGRGYDDAVMDRMRTVSGQIPVTTTSTASLRALRTFSAKKISIVTPYLDEITARSRIFFEQNGIQVLSAQGMKIDTDHNIGAVPLEHVYRFAKQNCDSASDALFMSCTNWRTVGAIKALEQDLGIPVISAIQASFWDCLRIARVNDGKEDFGRLFRNLKSCAAGEGSQVNAV